MSDITADVQRTIDTILRLSGGTDKNLIIACQDYLCTKLFPDGELKSGISKSVIPMVLPPILKCLKSKNSTIQQEGAFFIDAIISTPNQKEHAKLVIDKGVIPLLIKNLSSKVIKVLDQTLACLGKIAFHYPRDVIENGICEPLYKCLQSKNELIVFQSVKFLAILLTNCEAKISDILDADSIGSLLRAIKRHDSDENRYSLVNYLSPDFNDAAALESLKAIFNWLLASKPMEKTDDYLSDDQKIIKLLALKLIKNAISLYGEAVVDIIERENFLPPILKHIYGATKNGDIRIEAVSVIDDIIVVKPDFLLSLIDDYRIISLLSKNLSNENVRLLEAVLRTLKNSIEKCQDACRRKIKDFGSRAVLEKLGEHENEEIKQLSKDIQDFIDVSQAAEAVDKSDNEVEIIEPNSNDVDSRIALVERPQTRQHSRQHQKRRATPFPDKRPLKKRPKTSNECNDNEHSDSSANDDNDIGDHPEIFSSQNLVTVAATADPNNVPQVAPIRDVLAEIKPPPQPPSSAIEMIIPDQITTTQTSSQSALPGHQSSVAQNVTVAAAGGTSSSNLNPTSSTSGNLSTSPSPNSSTLLQPAATDHRATTRNEIQPPPPPPPRHQSLAHQNAAAAADGTPQSNLNPTSSTSGNLSTSSSNNSSALSQPAATTNHRTTNRTEMQPPPQSPGHQSPDHQNAAAAADGTTPQNNLNPTSSTSGNLSRSSSRNSSTATHHGTSSSNYGNPSSPSRSPNSPALPEGSATDERNQSPSQKPSPFSLELAAAASQNNNYFAPFEYLYPVEAFIKKALGQNYFGMKYYKQGYSNIFNQIEFDGISMNSKPAEILPLQDETGFGCISMFFTGSEENAKIIRDKINAKFVSDSILSNKFDSDKASQIVGSSFLTNDHLEFICRWLECRVMVYCNEKWELYGNWKSADYQNVFVLEKKTINETTIYGIVKSVVIDVE